MSEHGDPRRFRLSPSDFAFLWDECRRCFYLKARRLLARPSVPFPAVFSRIDSLTKERFLQPSGWDDVVERHGLPRVVDVLKERTLRSQPVSIERYGVEIELRGRYDTLLRFADGSYCVVDFKTTVPRRGHLAKYGRQLEGYALALEHPAPASFGVSPVARLALLCASPDKVEPAGDSLLRYVARLEWLEMPRDSQGFLEFLHEVAGTLAEPEPPAADPACPFCAYRVRAVETGL